VSYVVVRAGCGEDRARKNRLYKALLGTTSSTRGRRYRSRGLLSRLGGVWLSGGVYLVPVESVETLLGELERRGLGDCVEILDICLCPCGQRAGNPGSVHEWSFTAQHSANSSSP
jgi:hypothetical protein